MSSRSFALALFALTSLCANSNAHYDADGSQGRHYYKTTTLNDYEDSSETDFIAGWNALNNKYTYDGPFAPAAHPSGSGMCQTSASVYWSWCWHVKTNGNPFDAGIAVWSSEYHCAYDEEHNGEGCVLRSDHCAQAAGTTLSIDLRENHYGLNIPSLQDEPGLEQPFSLYESCSLKRTSAIDNGGWYAMTYVVTGDFHLDHDRAGNVLTLKQAWDNYDPVNDAHLTDFVDCIPNGVDAGTGEDFTGWGQTCSTFEPPNPPPSDTPPPPPSGTVLQEGAATAERQDEQTGILEEIRDELANCDPTEELCGDGQTYGLPGLFGEQTFSQSTVNFWNDLAQGPWAAAFDGQAFSTSGGQCPVATFPLFGETFTIDFHCSVIDSYRPVFTALFMLFWIGGAIRILFTA